MDNDLVIFTACDATFFGLCRDLIASIKNTHGFLPRIRVLDVGLSPAQAEILGNMVEKVIEPGWDAGGDMGLPPWYRAMSARAFLPNYAGDAKMIAWLDGDTWLQRAAPFQALTDAARDGSLAIVEERFGRSFTLTLPSEPGTTRTRTYSAEGMKANIRGCYEKCFGPQVAIAYGELPCFNAGAFALRADSPSWAVWQQLYTKALAQHFHYMVEQQALNVAIRSGAVPVSVQPLEANYTCHMELPWFAEDRNVFTFPGDENRVLGTIHLCDMKQYVELPIPQFPYGLSTDMPLTYDGVRRFIAGKR